MLAFSWYMLKVVLCSGILFGYYWVFLRNKIFHRYNRFYLISAILLSLLLPLLKIDFWQPEQQQSQVIRVLQVVSAGDEYMNNLVVTADQSSWTVQDIYPLLYALVSILVFILMVRTLLLIRSLLKKYPVQQVEQVAFVNTDDNSTPFSFLQYIFWNSSIDINTTTGRQIFKHEVAHIQERHTHDKLFVNLVLIVFWSNPFFWLYRKELNMIHEFIADQKAVEDCDTAAFAAMILQAAYPRHRFELANNFFYSPIKRRLLMLTKMNNPRVSYFARVMALPLLLLVFAAFTFKAKEGIYKSSNVITDTLPLPKSWAQAYLNNPGRIRAPVLFYEGIKIDSVKFLKNGNAEFCLRDGKKVILDQLEASKCGLLLTVPTPSSAAVTKASTKKIESLVIVDGVMKEKGFNLDGISPADILCVEVLKDSSAIVQYGEQGKDGVLMITTRNYHPVVEQAVDPQKALLVVNGKVIGKGKMNEGEFHQLHAESITVNWLGKEDAMAKYGTDGEDGACEMNYVNGITITTSYLDENKMSVFYIGINNPLTVTAQNIKPEELQVKISRGRVSGSNGRYMIQVSEPGQVTLTFSKKDGTVLPGTFTIRTAVLPDPVESRSINTEPYALEYKVNGEKLLEAEKQNLLATQMQESKLAYQQQVLKTTELEAKAAIEKKVYGQLLDKSKAYITGLQKSDAYLQLQSAQLDRSVQPTRALSEKRLRELDAVKLNHQLLLAQQSRELYDQSRNDLLAKSTEGFYERSLQGQESLALAGTITSPSFVGGEDAWQKYLAKNLKASIPMEEGWKPGKYTVLVIFLVHTDGTVSNVTARNYQGTKTAGHCIEIIRKAPKWKPALQNGQKVNAYRIQPITFIVGPQ